MAERAAAPARRLVDAALFAALAAGVAWFAWGLWYDRELPARLERVHLGMDRRSVEAVLGDPDWEGACGGYVASLPREGCARELGYASALAPLFPTYYLVQLDRNGRVVETEAIEAR